MAVHAPYIGGIPPPYLENPYPSSHTQAAPVGGYLVDQFPLQGFFSARFSSCKGGHLKTAHWAFATTLRGGRRSRPSAGARTRSTGSRDPWCAPGRSKRPPEHKDQLSCPLDHLRSLPNKGPNEGTYSKGQGMSKVGAGGGLHGGCKFRTSQDEMKPWVKS